MTIPVIDFSKLHGDDRTNTMAQIATCCEEWGFFQLINHGISEELLESVKKVASDCYKLEQESNFKKSKPVRLMNELIESNKTDEKLENVDWEDVFLLSDDNDHQWPSETPTFKETMKQYRSEVKKLTIKVMGIMDENLGLPTGYINRAFNGGNPSSDSAFFGTKVSHYPPCPMPESVRALRAHTDAGGVVLLFQDDEVKGLEILKDGAWIDVQPVRNAVVINTGDQVEALSNGRYKSAWHRVVATRDGNRRSIASFYNPSYEATIEPAEGLSPGDHERGEYPKFVFGDYMSVYANQKFMPKEPRFSIMQKLPLHTSLITKKTHFWELCAILMNKWAIFEILVL